MTRNEMLLTTLGEECAEVIQRVSKALRFGLDEIQQGQDKTNAQRILIEFVDCIAVLEMLQTDGAIPIEDGDVLDEMTDSKKVRVEKWLGYSAEMGTVDETLPTP